MRIRRWAATSGVVLALGVGTGGVGKGGNGQVGGDVRGGVQRAEPRAKRGAGANVRVETASVG